MGFASLEGDSLRIRKLQSGGFASVSPTASASFRKLYLLKQIPDALLRQCLTIRSCLIACLLVIRVSSRDPLPSWFDLIIWMHCGWHDRNPTANHTLQDA